MCVAFKKRIVHLVLKTFFEINLRCLYIKYNFISGNCQHIFKMSLHKGAFTLAISARDFALSLHILLTKIIFFITKHAILVRNRA